ncbi:unnamed protein product [Protopolystoma xenopodis]|uniref:Inositol polyphosphate-related phosphatase domain-containing protein n=1 Tax=Protopolystoma xenopodis TaxID=117903 RepID=A0A3S5AAN2_9PLAT|nr:unnamed protein product [Protopolystoma xenopodis]
MVHRDFALDHHLNLDKKIDKRSPTPSRKHPVRGPPSEVEQKFPISRSINKPVQHPEAHLLLYTALPEYHHSDHRPVIAKFNFAIPDRWFCLPVHFLEPSSYSKFLNFWHISLII